MGYYLDFYHMDGVPAALDPLCVTRLLDQDYTGKSMVQVPKVHRTQTTFKVPGRKALCQYYRCQYYICIFHLQLYTIRHCDTAVGCINSRG